MIEKDRIYHMDCLQGMKQMADGSVDAIIADLPYGVLNNRNTSAGWDRQLPLETLWEEYLRISKPESPVILFSQGMFTARLMLSQPKMWRYNLVWLKDRVTGHLNANRMPLRQHEDIIVFYRRQPVYHPQMKPCDAEHRNHSRSKTSGFTNRCYGQMRMTPIRMADNKYPTSVIAIAKEHEVKQISAQHFISKYGIGSPANARRLAKAMIEKELVLETVDKTGVTYQVYDVFFSRWLEREY